MVTYLYMCLGKRDNKAMILLIWKHLMTMLIGVMEDSPPFLTNDEVDAIPKVLANMTIQQLSNDIGMF